MVSLALLAAPASAQQVGQLGIGAVLGDPIGLTGKYWVKDAHAFDFGFGASHTFVMWGDYVWHGWEALPQPSRGKLALYLSAGPRLETRTTLDIGIRTMIGLSYWPKLKSQLWEMFIELGPTYRLTNDVRVRVDGGVGLRYYFTPIAKK